MSEEILDAQILGAPEPTAQPMTGPRDLDLGELHQEREQLMEASNSVSLMRSEFPDLDWDGPGTGVEAGANQQSLGLAGDAASEEVPTQALQPMQGPSQSIGEPSDVAADLVGSMDDEPGFGVADVGKDIFHGAIETPIQAWGGFLEGIKEINDMGREFANWATDNVSPIVGGGVIVDSDGVRFASGDEIKNTETFARWLLPEIDEADSVTGGVVRSISQFLTGFMGAGKIKAIQGISNPWVQATARGAVADFAVFDPHEDRLSDLIQESPALANPVNEFLAADPEDGAAEGRLKSMVEGLGLGLAVDSGVRVFRALSAGLKNLRAMRKVQGVASEAVDPLQGVIDTAERRREALTELIGDPEAPRLEVRPEVDAAESAPALELERTGDALPAEGAVVGNWEELPRGADNWEQLPDGRLVGYRVSRSVDGRAVSGADARQSSAMEPGAQVEFEGDGVFVTNDLEYAKTHYGVHDENAVQRVSFSRDDVTSGRLADAEPEISVRSGEVIGSDVFTDPDLAPTPHPEAPAVAEAREAVEAVRRMKVAELREAGLMPEKGGRKSDLLEEAEKRLEEAEQVARTEEPDSGIGTDEAAQAVAGARAVPEGGASAAEGSGKAFINWARIDSVDDVKAVMQDMADASAESIDAASRGVRSWDQTRLDAGSIDAWDMLMERRMGDPFNAEQSVAARELWAQSGAKLRELAEAVVADPGSEVSRIAFRRQLSTHNFIQEGAMAARTEIARSLNAWKMPVGDSIDFAGQFDQLRQMALRDEDGVEIAQRLVAMQKAGMTAEADAFMYGTAAAKGAGMIRQMWYASMLSGPHTHARNMLSNVATIGLQLVERKAASALGRAFGEQNIPDGETTAMAFGVLQGFKDALRISAKGRKVAMAAAQEGLSGNTEAARGMLRSSEEEFGSVWRSAVTGESGMGVGKVELPRLGAFDPERLGISKDNPFARVASFMDTVTTAPMRGLMVEDELFKAMNFRAELNAQAYRQATKELNAGQIDKSLFEDRLTQLVNDPNEIMRLEARDFAQKGTFTNDPLETGFWKGFSGVAKIPVIGRAISPFVRTPYNVATFAYQRTPLAPITKQWRDDLMEGGAKSDLAWSKFLVGNAILASFMDLAMGGNVSGEGPSNYTKSSTKRRLNWAPYSIRAHTGGDPEDPENYRNFSYRGLEPLAFHIGVAANIVEILEERDFDDKDAELDELILVTTMSIANQATSASFMWGVSSFFEMMADPQRNAEHWTQGFAGALMPTGAAQVARGADPTSRAVGDWVSQIRSRTPGLSKDLPANRDVWGRPIDRSSGLGTAYDFLSPVYSSKKKIEPIDRELGRLELWLNRPGKVVSFDGVKVNLRNHLDVWSRYVELSGNELQENGHGVPVGMMGGGLMDELNALVKGEHPLSPVYEMLTDGPEGGKAEQIRKIQREYKEAARDQLLEEFPWLKAEVGVRDRERPTKFNMEMLGGNQ